MPLIPYADVRGLLPTQELTEVQLDAAMKLVAGWLRGAADTTALPAELTEDHPLYAAAVELVILTVTNPEGVQSRGYGPKTRTYDTENRRKVILDGVRERYRTAALAPSGSFPPASVWPDPARPERQWPTTCL